MNRFVFTLTGAVLALLPAAMHAQEKRRVAVLDFQYATVMSSVQATFGGNQDIGKGICDLLIDRLVKDGTYRVIERATIAKIMAEQNFSNSDRADSTTAAKIGRLLGVDTVITGDITQFGRDDHSTGVGGALGSWDKFGVGKIKVGKSKAVVAITARLIDVNTGEVLASEQGKGQSTRSDSNLLGGGGAAATGGAGALDMGSSGFGQTIIGEAVAGAVTELATKMEADSAKVPHTMVKVNALVADATGDSITINAGTRAGIKVGDHLVITRVAKVIKDPVTDKPIRTIEAQIGDLMITTADEGSAVGTFKGTGAPKVGDTVKTP